MRSSLGMLFGFPWLRGFVVCDVACVVYIRCGRCSLSTGVRVWLCVFMYNIRCDFAGRCFACVLACVCAVRAAGWLVGFWGTWRVFVFGAGVFVYLAKRSLSLCVCKAARVSMCFVLICSVFVLGFWRDCYVVLGYVCYVLMLCYGIATACATRSVMGLFVLSSVPFSFISCGLSGWWFVTRCFVCSGPVRYVIVGW